jgi:hypothetical protein
MPSTDKPFSRREFTRRAALGAATAAILPLSALVPPADGVLLGQPQSPQTPAPNAPKLSQQSQAEADARRQAILNQYGDRFSEVQKNDLKRLCISAQPPLDRIRAYSVSNGDLPALYLKPLVDRDKKPSSGSPGAKPSLPSARKSGASAAAKPSASEKP